MKTFENLFIVLGVAHFIICIILCCVNLGCNNMDGACDCLGFALLSPTMFILGVWLDVYFKNEKKDNNSSH